mmetsp:Transcript_79356/g.202080  ORF Transcript_79356/g.202080 Transcript_79356/m.202080 type:complete len:251 (-) Transcript_79356:123-875(-)
MVRRAALISSLLLATSCDATSLRRPAVLDTPDLTAYDPTDVLCTLSKRGKKEIQPWCKNWLACIKTGASPAGDAAAVRSAWKPADCKEVCGKWPATTGPEGGRKSFLLMIGQGAKDCEASCANFQKSLTGCVAKILFEPGQVAAMGAPKKGAPPAPAPPAQCTGNATSCVPDLPIQYQSCMVKNHPSKCKNLRAAVEDCKDCPALKNENAVSQYAAFVGGCMAQLNAYWQATHSSAGGYAIPGAKGCTVH